MKTLVDFPDLTADEIAHSEKLIEKIINSMDGGVISFADYMHQALYTPGLGYYTAGSTKIGESGDFVTAPEISSLFGQCLASAISQRFELGCESNILEFGAGTGKLCYDIVQQLAVLNIEWQQYFILETSADLIQRQQVFLKQKLSAEQFSKVVWIHQVPEQYSGMVIGNEVMDAMPANIVIKQQAWHELGVAFENERFAWKEVSGESVAAKLMSDIEQRHQLDLAEGYCTEINLQHSAWLKSLYEQCKAIDVLLIDYGYFQQQYYHAERNTGTLMCYFRHRSHSDPLVLPGLQDITTSVDFTALAEAAEACGFVVHDISSQAEFLMRHDLLELAMPLSEKQPLHTAQEIKTLTLPAEMGETFKVMSFSNR